MLERILLPFEGDLDHRVLGRPDPRHRNLEARPQPLDEAERVINAASLSGIPGSFSSSVHQPEGVEQGLGLLVPRLLVLLLFGLLSSPPR